MIKKLLCCLLVLILSVDVKSSDPVIVNNSDFPPYFFIENTNHFSGIGREVLELCFKELGLDSIFEAHSIKRGHKYMQEGVIDMCAYSFKKERLKYCVIGKEPLFTVKLRFFVKSDSNIQVNSLNDIDNLRFGYLSGISLTPELLDIVKEKEQKGEVNYANNTQSLLLQLIADIKRFDITADSAEVLWWKAQHMNISDKVKMLPYVIKDKHYYLAISKNSKNIPNPEELINKIDTILKRMKQDGTYNSIMSKYGLIP